MGISRISRQKWLAVPMMAAAIGLSAPASANAATTASAPTAATVSSTSSGSTPNTLRITPDQLFASESVTEVSLGSFRGDRRGADRWKKL